MCLVSCGIQAHTGGGVVRGQSIVLCCGRMCPVHSIVEVDSERLFCNSHVLQSCAHYNIIDRSISISPGQQNNNHTKRQRQRGRICKIGIRDILELIRIESLYSI